MGTEGTNLCVCVYAFCTLIYMHISHDVSYITHINSTHTYMYLVTVLEILSCHLKILIETGHGDTQIQTQH